jgi:L-ribulose-5-phosphate 3-epimerase UlaE
MITLNIDDKNIENIFLNEFHSNKEKFFEFIKLSFDNSKAKKSDEDWSYLEDEVQKGIDSGRSGKTHKEVFGKLRKKYAIH